MQKIKQQNNMQQQTIKLFDIVIFSRSEEENREFRHFSILDLEI